MKFPEVSADDRTAASCGRTMSRASVLAAALTAGVVALSGCGKPPTFNELVGTKPDTSAPQEAPVTEIPVVEATPQKEPEPPPKPNAEAVIEHFLGIDSYDIRDVDIERVAVLEEGLEKLEKMDLDGSKVTPNGLSLLPKFVGVKELDVSGVDLSDIASRNAIGQMTQLEVLRIERTPLPTDTCSFLAELVNLRELNLNGTGISDQAFKVFEKLVNLESINVANCRVDGSGFIVFDRRGKANLIKHVDASNTTFGEWGFAHVKAWPQLETLTLRKAKISDKALLFGLKGMSSLKNLDLWTNPYVSDVGVKQIATIDTLERLNLSYCDAVSDKGVSLLKNLKQLKHLDLTNTKCTPPIVPFLKKTAPDIEIILGGKPF